MTTLDLQLPKTKRSHLQTILNFGLSIFGKIDNINIRGPKTLGGLPHLRQHSLNIANLIQVIMEILT